MMTARQAASRATAIHSRRVTAAGSGVGGGAGAAIGIGALAMGNLATG